jgi:FkbH-like protein
MKALLIADFSINNLAGYLKNDLLEYRLETVLAPFNQVHQTLIDEQLECWQNHYDFAILWAQPERVLSWFNALLNNEKFDKEALDREIDEYADLLISASLRVKLLFVATWTIDQTLYYQGFSSNQSGEGVMDVLASMNTRLAARLNTVPTISLINSSKWISNVGRIAYSPKLWYLTKTPFHSSVFAHASKDIASFIRNANRNHRKLIVLDLDNTLWGGVVGDVGSNNLVLGGHHPIGEAFKDFQLALKSMLNAGVLLAITSKNEESVALEVLENHPEMVLRKEHFVCWRINWEDKAKNIFEIADELNLGLDSVVFLDDNPFERERVKYALPDVFVPELPDTPLFYKHFLLQMDCFNTSFISEEDRRRTGFYSEERQRRDGKSSYANLEDWLLSIEIKVKYESLTVDNVQRVGQLLNKTNQMNLQTNRYTDQELIDRIQEMNQEIYAFSVKDNFGDTGLTGVVGLKIEDKVLLVTDFVLSCRVIGRKIEETMLSVLIDIAHKSQCDKVVAHYLPTEKNKPCFDFFMRSGFEVYGTTFSWDVDKEYLRPYYIALEFVSSVF